MASGKDGSSDESLMAAVMHGSHDAFAELVDRHYSLILGYLYRHSGGDRLLAEDLTQETFLRLLRKPGYEHGRPFRPWLYAIASHLAHDHFKSAAVRHHTVYDAATDRAAAAMAPDPEDQVLAADETRAVAAAIGQLAEEYRATLLLRFYNGLSLAEIAEALDIPLGTVKSRLSVGTRRLREALGAARNGASR